MSQEHYRLDDRYTEGIWRDMDAGDFAQIQEADDSHDVELVNPENGNVYWDMSAQEWCESAQYDFVKVPQDAVDDPVNYVNRAVRILQRNDINELSGLPMDFSIGLSWARTQVSVEEDRTC